MRIKTAFITGIFTLGLSVTALAQVPAVQTPVASTTMPTDNMQATNEATAKDSVRPPDQYVEPNIQNLSKLYWAMAVYDYQDDEAIENFLRINECDLYKKYYNDDFALRDLRDVMRESIKQRLSTFPLKMEIMLKIGLDRYDMGSERFKVSGGTQFLGSKKIEFLTGVVPFVCGVNASIPRYPHNFIINLNRPFTLTEISVPPEIAKAYIESSKKVNLIPDGDSNLSDLGRRAYLRLKISIYQFKDVTIGTNQEPLASLIGVIDGYEVYGEKTRETLLYDEKIEQDVLAKKKRTATDRENLKLEDGPLLKPSTTDPNLGKVAPTPQ